MRPAERVAQVVLLQTHSADPDDGSLNDPLKIQNAQRSKAMIGNSSMNPCNKTSRHAIGKYRKTGKQPRRTYTGELKQANNPFRATIDADHIRPAVLTCMFHAGTSESSFILVFWDIPGNGKREKSKKEQVSFPRTPRALNTKSRDRKEVGQHCRARSVRQTHPALTLRAR